jgi:hypothetical protein
MTHKTMIAIALIAAAALVVPTALHAKSKRPPNAGISGSPRPDAPDPQKAGDARQLGAKVGEGLAKAAPNWLW